MRSPWIDLQPLTLAEAPQSMQAQRMASDAQIGWVARWAATLDSVSIPLSSASLPLLERRAHWLWTRWIDALYSDFSPLSVYNVVQLRCLRLARAIRCTLVGMTIAETETQLHQIAQEHAQLVLGLAPAWWGWQPLATADACEHALQDAWIAERTGLQIAALSLRDPISSDILDAGVSRPLLPPLLWQALWASPPHTLVCSTARALPSPAGWTDGPAQPAPRLWELAVHVLGAVPISSLLYHALDTDWRDQRHVLHCAVARDALAAQQTVRWGLFGAVSAPQMTANTLVRALMLPCFARDELLVYGLPYSGAPISMEDIDG